LFGFGFVFICQLVLGFHCFVIRAGVFFLDLFIHVVENLTTLGNAASIGGVLYRSESKWNRSMFNWCLKASQWAWMQCEHFSVFSPNNRFPMKVNRLHVLTGRQRCRSFLN